MVFLFQYSLFVKKRKEKQSGSTHNVKLFGKALLAEIGLLLRDQRSVALSRRRRGQRRTVRARPGPPQSPRIAPAVPRQCSRGALSLPERLSPADSDAARAARAAFQHSLYWSRLSRRSRGVALGVSAETRPRHRDATRPNTESDCNTQREARSSGL